MSQEQFKKRLKALMDRPENQICSDCPERQPRWASIVVPPPGAPPGMLPMGAFCCLECSGSHRRLGVHVSFVRSITLDQWKENEVLAMENGGNKKINAIYEARLSDVSIKPQHHASGQVRERFIRDKYERRKYFDLAVLHRYASGDASVLDANTGSLIDDHPLASKTSAVAGNNIRAPSDAAKIRAETRRNRLPNASSNISDSSRPTATMVPLPSKHRSSSVPSHAEQTSVNPPPMIDLLDFNLLPTSSNQLTPPPEPPSLQASPNLDLFKHMKLNDFGDHSTKNPEATLTPDIFSSLSVPPKADPLAPSTNINSSSVTSTTTTSSTDFNSSDKKKILSSHEILAMFGTTSNNASMTASSNHKFHSSMSSPNLGHDSIHNPTPSSGFDFFNHIPTTTTPAPSMGIMNSSHLQSNHNNNSVNMSMNTVPNKSMMGSNSIYPVQNSNLGMKSGFDHLSTSMNHMNNPSPMMMTTQNSNNLTMSLNGGTSAMMMNHHGLMNKPQPSGMDLNMNMNNNTIMGMSTMNNSASQMSTGLTLPNNLANVSQQPQMKQYNNMNNLPRTDIPPFMAPTSNPPLVQSSLNQNQGINIMPPEDYRTPMGVSDSTFSVMGGTAANLSVMGGAVGHLSVLGGSTSTGYEMGGRNGMGMTGNVNTQQSTFGALNSPFR